MRVKLVLSAVEGREIPLNYYYYLSSAIYKILEESSPQFSDFLHNQGYKLEGKKYKLFTFSLIFNRMKIAGNSFFLLDRHVTLYISFPDFNKFLENLVTGAVKISSIYIDKTHFLIEEFAVHPQPEFTDNMKFTLLSPMVISTKIDKNGRTQQHYFRYYEDLDEQNRILTQNLSNKYALTCNRQPQGDVKIKWDEEYIARLNAQGKRATAKATIPKDGVNIEIIGNKLPFTISGNPELIKTGYECGFGEKNSMGFGMAEEVVRTFE